MFANRELCTPVSLHCVHFETMVLRKNMLLPLQDNRSLQEEETKRNQQKQRKTLRYVLNTRVSSEDRLLLATVSARCRLELKQKMDNS